MIAQLYTKLLQISCPIVAQTQSLPVTVLEFAQQPEDLEKEQLSVNHVKTLNKYI